MRFIDRTEERARLDALWDKPGLQMAIVYGRRRLGKSYLLDHVFAGRKGVLFIATQSTSSVLLAEFLETARDQLKDADLTIDNYPNWRSALRYFADAARGEPLYLIWDEFGYMVDANSELPSIIQATWTAFANKSRLRLILCGSQVSLMRELAANATRPLFGNTTAQEFIEPLSYRDAADFVPSWTDRDKLTLYGCLGGSGRYLDLVDETKTLETNLTELIVDRGPLYEEGAKLILEEQGVQEVKLYNAVLTAIANGATQRADILSKADVTAGQLQKVLDTLQELLLVEHDIPYGEKTRGVWIISDNFVRFWFRFIHPNTTQRAMLKPAQFWAKKIAPWMSNYMGWRVFEDICRSWVQRNASALPWGTVEEVRHWWQRDGQNEIDVVAPLDDKSIVFGSCKWSAQPVKPGEVTDLQNKVARLPHAAWRRNPHYILFSSAGFDPALVQRAKAEDVELVDAARLLQ